MTELPCEATEKTVFKKETSKEITSERRQRGARRLQGSQPPGSPPKAGELISYPGRCPLPAADSRSQVRAAPAPPRPTPMPAGPARCPGKSRRVRPARGGCAVPAASPRSAGSPRGRRIGPASPPSAPGQAEKPETHAKLESKQLTGMLIPSQAQQVLVSEVTPLAIRTRTGAAPTSGIEEAGRSGGAGRAGRPL